MATQEAPLPEAPVKTEPLLKLKGNLLTMTVLELKHYEYERFKKELAAVVNKAPNFFYQTPIVINLDKLTNPSEEIDFIEMMDICQEYGLRPIAIKGGSDNHQMAAIVAGLPQIPSSKNKDKATAVVTGDSQDDQQDQAEQTATEEKTAATDGSTPGNPPYANNKIVRTPIRSGQQVYAPGGDLIVLGSVSAGAEILADGNIHVYGAMRGRALAGVKGNRKALIFCQKLQAELLSIAGHYKISEDLRASHWHHPAVASLNKNQLIIDKLK